MDCIFLWSCLNAQARPVRETLNCCKWFCVCGGSKVFHGWKHWDFGCFFERIKSKTQRGNAEAFPGETLKRAPAGKRLSVPSTLKRSKRFPAFPCAIGILGGFGDLVRKKMFQNARFLKWFLKGKTGSARGFRVKKIVCWTVLHWTP